MNYPVPSKYEFLSCPEYISVPQYRNELEITATGISKTYNDLMVKLYGPDAYLFQINSDVRELRTPARINREAGTIEVSKSIFEADKKAMEIYLGMGHSRSEALNAFRDIFGNNTTRIDSGYRSFLQQHEISGFPHFDMRKKETVTFTFTVRPKGIKANLKLLMFYLKQKFSK